MTETGNRGGLKKYKQPSRDPASIRAQGRWLFLCWVATETTETLKGPSWVTCREALLSHILEPSWDAEQRSRVIEYSREKRELGFPERLFSLTCMLILRSQPGYLFTSGRQERLTRVGVIDQCLSCSSRWLVSWGQRSSLSAHHCHWEGWRGHRNLEEVSLQVWGGEVVSRGYQKPCVSGWGCRSVRGGPCAQWQLQNLSLEVTSPHTLPRGPA